MEGPGRRFDWPRLLLEGAIIVFSILAAFFLEGWRADRELARELDQELVNVHRELQTNRSLVATEVRSLDRIQAGSAALLVALEGASELDLVTVADTLAWLSTFWTPSFDPSLGAVEALTSSGRLAQIHDPDLRMGLAGLRDRLADAVEEEAAAKKITLEQLYPLVRDALDVTATLQVSAAAFSQVGEEGVATPQQAVEGRGLQSRQLVQYPNSAAIRSTMLFRMGWFSVGRGEFAGLLPHLDSLIAMAEREIGAS